MHLTEYEFVERLAYVVDEEHLPSQMALFVDLYYEALGRPKRWSLFKSALSASGISHGGLVGIAKSSKEHL